MARIVNVRHEPCDVYIGREVPGWPESPWGNPYRLEVIAGAGGPQYLIRQREPGGRWRIVAQTHSRRLAVDSMLRYYRIHVERTLAPRLSELVGRRLGCWCVPGRCHGEVLLALLVDRGLDVVDPDPQLGLELGDRRQDS